VGEEGPVPEIRRISPTEWAVYRGETYPAEERVPANVQLYRDGVPDQLVAIADLEQWYTVRTYGTFLEHEFEIYQERDGRLSIGVVGTGDGHWLAETWANPDAHPEVSFQRTDMYTFEALVPKDRVTDVHEVRTDHLERESHES